MAHLIDIVGENPDKYKMVLTRSWYNPTELACNDAALISNLNRKIAGGVAHANIPQGEIEASQKRNSSASSKKGKKKQRRAVFKLTTVVLKLFLV